MNKIVNAFLLAGFKLMPELHLRKPIFTYSACGQFTKKKKEKKYGNRRYEIYLSKRTR